LHQLCGSVNWVRPLLGITTEEMAPLFNCLTGGEELDSPRELTPEAVTALGKVEKAISEKQAHRYDPDLPFELVVLGEGRFTHGLIYQWGVDRSDPLLII
ncbi:POK19 protein, partial [Melanocharis versteri]|nr:POK19 protein [Melanocharis versteri]